MTEVFLNDTIEINGEKVQNPLNQEVVTIRAVVPGEYIVNIHYYATKTEQPVDVNVKVEKVNPQVRSNLLRNNKIRKKRCRKNCHKI